MNQEKNTPSPQKKHTSLYNTQPRINNPCTKTAPIMSISRNTLKTHTIFPWTNIIPKTLHRETQLFQSHFTAQSLPQKDSTE